MPASLELGNPALNTDFYNRESSIDYGTFTSDYRELATGSAVGDCRSIYTDNVRSINSSDANSSGEDVDAYVPCAHIAPEAWRTAHSDVEPPRDLGALGMSHLWVPKFTAERDTSILSYIGLQGEDNRRKLAETFKRPTTWNQYCEEVSNTTCATDDGIATRPPQNVDEDESYYVPGEYTGHFRYTDENDCDMNPQTCTGHAADYPCHWVSHFLQQTYHLDISLKSSGPSSNGGYSYSQLTQIWEAANATKSDVMMVWWNPEALYSTWRKFICLTSKFT